jgi:hypothetical protein
LNAIIFQDTRHEWAERSDEIGFKEFKPSIDPIRYNSNLTSGRKLGHQPIYSIRAGDKKESLDFLTTYDRAELRNHFPPVSQINNIEWLMILQGLRDGKLASIQ